MNANLLRLLISHLRECLGQEANQIRCDQRILAERGAGQIPCQAVEIHSQSRCFERFLRMLRNQTGNDSCQNVSGTSGCHTRIAGRIHPDCAIGRRDQGAMSDDPNRTIIAPPIDCEVP